MFTECPQCNAAFRITAKILQQAGGRVRCDRCANAFNAIDHLTEIEPASQQQAASPAGTAADEPFVADNLEETHRQLLEILEDLAAPQDERLQDSGTAWQALRAHGDHGQASLADAAPDTPVSAAVTQMPADAPHHGDIEARDDIEERDREAGEPVATEEEQAVDELTDEESAEVETVTMEEQPNRGSIEEDLIEAEHDAPELLETPESVLDGDAANAGIWRGWRGTEPADNRVIAGTIVLVLLLVGQLVHAYRESLSTYGLFNQTVGPLYRLLGTPVTPEWDVKGWRFEATNGNIAEDEGVLTIFSRIGNNSLLPLPYPLVHVSLTDRWEEIIGSRVLMPNEYLGGDIDPSEPVNPGDNFTAVITIDEPSTDATGFKLNVCYRVSPGRVRCATQDFED